MLPRSIALPSTLLIVLFSQAARGGQILDELGHAGLSTFTVLSFGGPNQVSGNALVEGNFGVGVMGTHNEYANSDVTGQGAITDPALLNQAIIDANNAASYFAGLSPTLTVPEGAIHGTLTITGVAGLNVIDVSGIDMTSGTLLFTGPLGAQFVINNSGVFLLHGRGVSILLGPTLTASDVLFNQTSNAKVQTSGAGNVENAILLAPTAHIQLNNGNWTGQLIDGMGFAAEGNESVMLDPPAPSGPNPPVTATPEPASLCLTAAGLIAGWVLRRRHRRGAIGTE